MTLTSSSWTTRQFAAAAPEALYVDDLIVPAGTTLNLNGLNLYIHTAQVEGTIIGGAIITGEVYDDVSGSGTLTLGRLGPRGLDGQAHQHVERRHLYHDHR